ncbi:MAG TPA: hypothetical protein VFB52_11620 [Solirubrobacterales bacterium]|nr:hypothetical protein [Solirubrobacterales bacterium]
MLAHIAGIPIEETILTFVPLTIAAGSVGFVLLRERARRRSYKRNAPEPQRSREPRRAIEPQRAMEPQR